MGLCLGGNSVHGFDLSKSEFLVKSGGVRGGDEGNDCEGEDLFEHFVR